MRRDEVFEAFPQVVSEAKIQFLMNEPGQPSFRCDPQAPDCVEAWQFHIQVLDEDDDMHERSRHISLSSEGEMTRDAAPTLDAVHSHIDNGLSLPVVPHVEIKKELTEEEQQAANEAAEARKRALLEKRNSPQNKAKQFISKIPMDISLCQKHRLETQQPQFVPAGVRLEYSKIFDAAERELSDLLQQTQQWVASEGDNNNFVSISVAVTKAVANFKDDCKAWKGLLDRYMKNDAKTDCTSSVGGSVEINTQ